MERETSRPVCIFLIPVVRDSDRQRHSPLTWRLLQDALIGSFGGVTGPETVVCYRTVKPVSGAWSAGAGDEAVEDLSLKYAVAIPAERVEELRSLLRRAGNSFDQRVMYLEVAGYAEFLEVRPEDGFLTR